MRILSLNCGSSSIRWGLFDVLQKSELESGRLEETEDPEEIWQRLAAEIGGLKPAAIGHRIVHGGEGFADSALIDEGVVAAVEAAARFAPAHNPRSLRGIREAGRLFPDIPQVAVFDTAFHQSMPPEAYVYPIPYRLFERDRIRRYGFHGTSHRFVSERARELGEGGGTGFTGVTCHLGNGCSITAIRDGRSVDTSMGMTPLEGLMMGTRSGDLDPAIVLQLASRSDMGIDQVENMLNRESGLLGVSGVSNDLREVERAAAAGVERAQLAIDLFAHRVRRGIGAALGVLGESEAIVFTGGIGEHSAAMRARVVGSMSGLGVRLDSALNRECIGREGCISTKDSAIAIFVIPSREEWLIAREVESIVRSAPN
ncbi:MAG: acetate/propionate family kinase [Myxococcota bacterium]